MEATEGHQEGRPAREVLARRLPSDEDAPRTARALVDPLIARFTDQIRANLHVAVSELVTNAVVHGAPGEVGVRVIVQPRTLRVEVSDAGMTPFEWDTGPGGPTGGWGMHLVKQFTDRCGVDRRPHTVSWCEFDLDATAG